MDSNNTSQNFTPPKTGAPALKLCASFDLIGSYYPLDNYRTFSFWFNGVAKCLLIIFGFFGNALLMYQGVSKNRMGFYLRVLCVYDTLLLFTSLAGNAVGAVLNKTMRVYGLATYVVFITNPLGNFAVTGTLWQIVTISMERYLHIVHPWMARIYDQRFSVKGICLFILLSATILNMTFFFGHKFEKCAVLSAQFRYKETSIQVGKTQLALESKIYKIAFDLIPDLLFRCPLPFILVAFFGICTLYQIYIAKITTPRKNSSRKISTNNKRAKIGLTMLTLKFLVCNSLFTVHVILDLLDTNSQRNPTDYWSYFLTMSYISDTSNLLLVLNASTNWLLFYNWRPTINIPSIPTTFHSELVPMVRSRLHSIRKSRIKRSSMRVSTSFSDTYL